MSVKDVVRAASYCCLLAHALITRLSSRSVHESGEAEVGWIRHAPPLPRSNVVKTKTLATASSSVLIQMNESLPFLGSEARPSIVWSRMHIGQL